MTNEPAPNAPEGDDSLPKTLPNRPADAAPHGPNLDEILVQWQDRARPYTNLVLTIVGGVLVVALGGWWLNESGRRAQDAAFVRLAEAKDASEIAAFEGSYASSHAHPYMLYSLAAKRADEAGFDLVKLRMARDDFKRLADLYPRHYLTDLSRSRAHELDENIKWAEESLPKQLSELDARRKAADELEKKGEKQEEPPKKQDEAPPKKDGEESGGGEKKDDGAGGEKKIEEPGK